MQQELSMNFSLKKLVLFTSFSTTAIAQTLPSEAMQCALGDHLGIEEADALTTREIVCSELSQQGIREGSHELSLGKLGSHLVLSLSSKTRDSFERRTVILATIEEVPKAAPRLVEAVKYHRALDDTKNTENILSEETSRTLNTQRGYGSFYMGLFALMDGSHLAEASGGVDLGVLHTTRNFAIEGHGRAAGIGSSANKLGLASLDIGGRYYLFGLSDTSPFLGGGIGFSYLQRNRKSHWDEQSGSGLFSYAQLGVELLRTYRTNLMVALRADFPLYKTDPDTTKPAPDGMIRKSSYTLPLSFVVGLQFR
jgi:hypothetical protein